MDAYEYSPSYNSTTPAESMPDASFALAIVGLLLITLVITYIIHAIFLGMIFKKAGIASWKAWVPIYNSWILLEMGRQPGWWAILAFVPVVNIVAAIFMYVAMYYIGLRLQKDGIFVLLAIFLPTVWLIWLAVDKSTWQGEKPSTIASPPNEI
jgi:hypothetical protein